ncbi:AraC-like DNA-binding protein [Crossiella equi]|uniref:AraC-like DNA-binding protein n=1 Tax=Crossiella equi TaxID=130796 RepID=A0ABS5A5T7_9PSEU|nr:AraC family transcriptional regulator [Crossiella equi]MBP2471961.1 AraC-like DNA-binding protein [Crossiella equi]
MSAGELVHGVRRLMTGADFETLRAMYEDYGGPEPVRVHSPTARSARFWVTYFGGSHGTTNATYGTSLTEFASDSAYELHGTGRADGYVVRVAVAGASRFTMDGRELVSVSTIQRPECRFSQLLAPGTRIRYLVLPPELVAQALRTRLGDEPRGPLEFEPELQARAPATEAWLRLANTWADPAQSVLMAQSPLALAHFEQVLVQSLLDTQPHTLTDLLGRGANSVPPGALRRAALYCEDHAHEPISVADIAAAANLSVRQLQRGFREQLGTTPLAHLRRVRLAQAHDELLAVAQGRAEGTITDVAHRWGFVHLGRFAEYYRAEYGRTPSQTVHG